MESHNNDLMRPELVLVTSFLANPHVHTHSPTNEAVPRGWREVILAMAKELGMARKDQCLGYSFRRDGIWFCWHPSTACLLAAKMGQPLFYLYWGGVAQRGVKGVLARLRLGMILRKARVVMTNDPVSGLEIRKYLSEDPRIVPYVVDTDFYHCSQSSHRQGIVVPGNNGRDEGMVFEAIRRGMPVVRVTSSEKVRGEYEAEGLASFLRFKLSYPELRDTYQQCSVVALPIADSSHAAGQTAALEALSCGARVVVTEGRVGELLQQYPSVHLAGNASDFLEITARRESESFSQADRLTSEMIRRKHSVEACVDVFKQMLVTNVRDLKLDFPSPSSVTQHVSNYGS